MNGFTVSIQCNSPFAHPWHCFCSGSNDLLCGVTPAFCHLGLAYFIQHVIKVIYGQRASEYHIFVFCFSGRVSLLSPDCPEAGSVDQAIIFKRPNGHIMLGPHILKRNALRRMSCCLFVADGLLCYEHWHSVFPGKSPNPLCAEEEGLCMGVNTRKWEPLACLSDIP